MVLGLQLRQVSDPLSTRTQTVEPNLKLLVQFVEHGRSSACRTRSSRLAESSTDRHALGVVDDNSDDVLLRPQRRDAERGLPEQDEEHGNHRRLQQPDQRPASRAGQSFGPAVAPQRQTEARPLRRQAADTSSQTGQRAARITSPFGERCQRILKENSNILGLAVAALVRHRVQECS